MKRTCKACHRKYGTLGAIIHVHTVHKEDPTKENDWQWLKEDIKNREVYDLQMCLIYPFYWFGLVLVAVFDPVIWAVKAVVRRWKR